MRKGINLILILSLVIMGCTENKNQNKNQAKMELMVLSNYGADQKIIADSTTVVQIKNTMNGINWNNFHQVILSIDSSKWIEVGGNLNEDGLSARYEENGKQFVINEPPSSVDHMTEILISYFNGDEVYKKENKFD